MNLTLGISTCPNDTYIFGPMITGLSPFAHSLQVAMDDVEVLNRLALEGALDIVKVSYGVVPKVLDNYRILSSGGALGFGCGPLLVSKSYTSMDDLKGKTIAIPGANTTAFRIFKHFYGDLTENFVELRFDLIMPAIASGQVDAGLVIHEGRFVYQNFGMVKLIDLGELWEQKYSAPIPLGAIIIKKELAHLAEEINTAIRLSIHTSETNWPHVQPFVKKYAAELSDEVIKAHIDLYVNDFSKDLTPATDSLAGFLQCDPGMFL